MKIDPATFLDRVAEYTQDSTQTSADKPMRLAIIDPAYAGVGLPKIKFDGELTVSGKQYAVMGDYVPAASDRVVLAPVGTTYLILGRVRDTNVYVPPTPDTWHALPMSNSWTTGVQYRKLDNGYVAFKGTTSGGTATTGILIGTLPVGWRPVSDGEWMVARSGQYGTSKISISTAGAITYWANDAVWTAQFASVGFPTS